MVFSLPEDSPRLAPPRKGREDLTAAEIKRATFDRSRENQLLFPVTDFGGGDGTRRRRLIVSGLDMRLLSQRSVHGRNEQSSVAERSESKRPRG